jgi:hypothetical protein
MLKGQAMRHLATRALSEDPKGEVFGTATLPVNALDDCGKNLVIGQFTVCKLKDHASNLIPHAWFSQSEQWFHLCTSGLDYSLQRSESLGIAFHRGSP